MGNTTRTCIDGDESGIAVWSGMEPTCEGKASQLVNCACHSLIHNFFDICFDSPISALRIDLYRKWYRYILFIKQIITCSSLLLLLLTHGINSRYS